MWIAFRGPHEARCAQLQAFAEELVRAYPLQLTILWEAGDENGPHVLLWQAFQGVWQVRQGNEEAIASWLHTLGAQLRAARRKPESLVSQRLISGGLPH